MSYQKECSLVLQTELRKSTFDLLHSFLTTYKYPILPNKDLAMSVIKLNMLLSILSDPAYLFMTVPSPAAMTNDALIGSTNL